MTQKLAVILLLLAVSFSLRAQVVIYNDNVTTGRLSEIKATVVDSLSREPVPFASVYVTPVKDSTITNFTLTDTLGVAKLDEVPYGNYLFHVEMMGYKPFVRERYFRLTEVDMGTIYLQADEYFLQAATVSDVGNPIVVKKDTVEFNASSFRVGANAMLKDLLQRMPGMEITEDGKVKFNGEEVDKLTVGGRTFFFNDQSVALNNLPASIVDKIRVIDRESEEAQDTGIKERDREKVLDVALKKEYEKGWFGNVGVRGGTTLAKKEGAILRDDRGFLFTANALVSAYSEKDQLTVIANAQNVDGDNGGMVFVTVDDEGDFTNLNEGLSTAGQLGANLNTSRIKDVESTVSASYTGSITDSGSKTARTTYQENGDLDADEERSGRELAQKFDTNLEMKKETGNFRFRIRPSFRFQQSNADSRRTAQTLRGGSLVNRSESQASAWDVNRSASVSSDFVLRELGGKKKRNLRLRLYGDYEWNDGKKTEATLLQLAEGAVENKEMEYVLNDRTASVTAILRYIEPLGEKWTLSAIAGGEYSRRKRVRDAFDFQGQYNDYYSSATRATSIAQEYGLTAQYTFGEESWVSFGAEVNGILNETFSKTYGNESLAGQNKWSWFVMPELEIEHSWGMNRLDFYFSGYSNQPSNGRLLPVLNISDPSRLSLGNVYLRPFSYSTFMIDWTRNNRQNFSTFMFDIVGTLRTSPITEAQWYDANGILYRIPVNARKPTINAWSMITYTTPLNEKKTWTLSLEGYFDYTATASYLAQRPVTSPDREGFDYTAFMADFWGDASGSRFYSGQSGFDEFVTHTFSPSANISLRLNQDRYSLEFRARTAGNIARYTPALDFKRNTLDTRFMVRGSYITKHEFEFESDLSYVFYRGYADGFGQPEWQWNASVNKSIGAFNLSLSVYDILNQTRNLSHTVSVNYVEDTYKLAMGRYILLGVKWNFGKMNAAHSDRAQDAARNMLW